MGNSSRSNRAIAFLFILVMTVGFAGAVTGLIRWSSEPADLRAATGDSVMAGLVNGWISERLEAEIDAGMPLRSPAVSALATARYLLFHTGNDGVVIGSDGWLYTREEFEHHPGDDSVLLERLAFITAVRDRLAHIEVGLLVALVPSKARIIPGPLPRRWAALGSHPRYETALGRLEALDIATVDLRSALGSIPEPFLHTDTHWSAEGARHAAQAVAGAAGELGLASGVPRTDFVTTSLRAVEITGDLITFLPIGGMVRFLGFPDESITVSQTAEISAPTLGLFDAPTIPVTLVGTSYSADERWNFVGELKQALHSDVLNISAEAVGPFVPMADYLAGATLSEVKPHYVLWEIPERYLTLPEIELPEL